MSGGKSLQELKRKKKKKKAVTEISVVKDELKDPWSLKAAFSQANWGVRMARAFAPNVKLNARNRVKVGVRIRPMSEVEKKRSDLDSALRDFMISEYDTAHMTIKNPRPPPGQDAKTDHFAFDHLYGPDATTERVFRDLALPLVHLLVDGYNGTIFAYGQTGSGKTHSIMGTGADPGIVPRTCDSLFKLIAQLKPGEGLTETPTVSASYLQIYCEKLHDLLDGSSLNQATDAGRDAAKDLKIRRGLHGIYVENLTEVPLDSAAKLSALIESGNKKRATSATLMNAASSRSHAVVIINLEGKLPAIGKKSTPTTFKAKLSLIDLAGSERVQKSGAAGETLKEAIAINQSLSMLGTVINALTEQSKPKHVPYRSSKLTHLLEDSLGGNSHTVMLAACSPSGKSYFETLSTMQYAARAKLIVCNPKVHDVPEAPEGSKDPEGDIRKSMMKQTWDWLPRYLRHEIDNTTLHAPRRSWMTGAEKREKVLDASPPRELPSPTRV